MKGPRGSSLWRGMAPRAAAPEIAPEAKLVLGRHLSSAAAGAGVFGDAQVIEDQAHVARKFPHSLGEAPHRSGCWWLWHY
jgi:hypothetical protein